MAGITMVVVDGNFWFWRGG